MIIWQNPSVLPKLAPDRIHVWRADLDLPAAQIEELTSLLAQDELIRANKFRFTEHKNSFVAARGILRQLLGHYLATEPQKLEFDYSDRGKPLLGKTQVQTNLQFNISHSQNYALFGFTYDRLIGVDLEYLREMKDAVKIARRFFSDREFKLIAGLDIAQQTRVFFQLWTAKEAYLKAIGVGLAGSLANIEITLNRAGDASILAINDNNFETKEWFTCSCIPEENYVAALATQTPMAQSQIDFWGWQ